jgi:very-short-patch-repair endonuclease
MKSEKWYAAMHARKGKGTNQYTKAKELGLPKPELSEDSLLKISRASSKRRHSDEVKKKISEARIKFLRENPDKVPYKLNHYSKGRSYAEDYWKNVLDSNNLKYEEQYQIGPYQLDFAFVDIKVDLEIDGDQHYLDKRIVESDKRRNAYLQDLGWKIIRVKWSEYQKLEDKKKYVSELIEQLDRWSSGQ